MGQARQRGSYEERRKMAMERTASEREVDISLVTLEPEPFNAVFEILNRIAVEAVALGEEMDTTVLKAYKQADGGLYVRADLPSGVQEVNVRAGDWSIPPSKSPPEQDSKDFRPFIQEMADNLTVQAAQLLLTKEQYERKSAVATADGIIACRTDEGLSVLDQLREIVPEAGELLNSWEASDNEFFVYAVDRQGIELVTEGVKDMHTLLHDFLPYMFKRKLAVELYSNFVVVGGTADMREEIHNVIDILQPLQSDLLKEGKIAFRAKVSK